MNSFAVLPWIQRFYQMMTTDQTTGFLGLMSEDENKGKG